MVKKEDLRVLKFKGDKYDKVKQLMDDAWGGGRADRSG